MLTFKHASNTKNKYDHSYLWSVGYLKQYFGVSRVTDSLIV